MRSNEIGFRAIADSMRELNGGWRADVPGSWRQGRTAYGGLTAGLALAAAMRAEPALPTLRSALVTYVGPASGELEIQPTILRRGRHVVSMEVVVRASDGVATTCAFLFGASRESRLAHATEPVDAPEPEGCEPYLPATLGSLVPEFTTNFDTRLIEGHRPFAGATAGHVRCWTRHRDPDSRGGAAAVLALADVLPPAGILMLDEIAPTSTLTWAVNFLRDGFESPDGWWQAESRLTGAGDGYSTQAMTLRDRGGALVAEGMQSVVTFG